MDSNLQVRKVPPKALYELVKILECENDWKKLMSVVPKSIDDETLKYNYEHVKLIEDASGYQRRPGAEIFLEEWGSSGRKQPTLEVLLQLLLKAELFRAAEYVAVQLLKGSAPERPKIGPAAAILVTEQNIQSILDERLKEIKLRRLAASELKKEVLDNSARSDTTNYSDSSQIVRFDLCVVEETQKDANKSFDLSIKKNSLHSALVSESGLQEKKNSSRTIEIQSLNTENVQHVSYSDLELCTNNFCEESIIPDNPAQGGKLGSGAFGSVYLGLISSLKVAVKRLNNGVVSAEIQFRNEVEALCRYRHENLLPLLGYSCDGPFHCLVYMYMSNGSLEDRLACQGSIPVLLWQERLNIALGAAQGILYLHTAYEIPLIHRDIKSANILLDDSLSPKLGDFGLVRLGPNGQQGQSVVQTSTIFGTSAYMAREAFWGDISIKLDSFSFGVVLLELLTSLPSYDENREGRDLITHVEDLCEDSIRPLLDLRAGSWLIDEYFNASEILHALAKNCLKERRHSRPDMRQIVDKLMKLKQRINDP